MKAIVLLKDGFKGFLLGVILIVVCFTISLTTAAVAFLSYGVTINHYQDHLIRFQTWQI